MNIKVLGTRGEIEESAPYHSKKSGVLIDTLLFDCGDKSFLKYNPTAILITHLHPDHAYFVRHQEKPIFHMPVYAPEKYDAITTKVSSKPFKVGHSTVIPLPTIHSIKVKSCAYLLERKGKRILYTGDMIWLEKKYYDLLGTLDLVITEASFMRKGGMVRRSKDTGKIFGHTGVPDLIRIFKQFTHTILFMHFGAWFYKDISHSRKQFNQLAKKNNMKLIVGYDGQELTI